VTPPNTPPVTPPITPPVTPPDTPPVTPIPEPGSLVLVLGALSAGVAARRFLQAKNCRQRNDR
jgi:hypothetical protein